ncbi:unnamed protein product [Ranitomeya imitator]|uniref:Helix-turn-helix domain-containing protein n=1 Tax=Ranitomeya imitator TaxID=111125 RepID=A0ABN9M822_9NEOB|nr:unnamed protein product [Ranitomeya imitator]
MSRGRRREYLQEAIKNTEEKIESIETQLTSTLSTTDLSTLKSKVDSTLATYQRTLETYGTAMGSNVALAYANLYMDRFEQEYGDHTSLQEFHNTINTIRPGLAFTLRYHNNEITFPDARVLKDSLGNLDTDIYSKPTEFNSLLLYNSCHPKSTKDSLPRSQFKRVSRIVSNPNVRATRIQEMSNKFMARNYPTDLLNTESIRALNEAPTSECIAQAPAAQRQEILLLVLATHCDELAFVGIRLSTDASKRGDMSSGKT